MIEKQKAIFLDRDGVINQDRHDYVKTIDELQIFDKIYEPIKILKQKGFLIIVVTNQSAINRKLTTLEKVSEIHSKIQKYLQEYDTHIDKFYFCPHTPTENCNCRKPKPGLLLNAISDFNIDPNISWLIGDKITDIEAGKSIGCQTLQITKNLDLLTASKIILNNS